MTEIHYSLLIAFEPCILAFMSEEKKAVWVAAGYQWFAESGPDSLNVLTLARLIGKNKSSFYHYFGDLPGYIEELLHHHHGQAQALAQQVADAQTITPDVLNALLHYQQGIFFQRQLCINRHQAQYKASYEAAYGLFKSQILTRWVHFLGFPDKLKFAEAFFDLIAENFLLRITPAHYTYPWMEQYLNEVLRMVASLKTQP